MLSPGGPPTVWELLTSQVPGCGPGLVDCRHRKNAVAGNLLPDRDRAPEVTEPTVSTP